MAEKSGFGRFSGTYIYVWIGRDREGKNLAGNGAAPVVWS